MCMLHNFPTLSRKEGAGGREEAKKEEPLRFMKEMRGTTIMWRWKGNEIEETKKIEI